MSPWTRKQVRYLLSEGSTLTEKEKAKMKRELHGNPALGHAKKGFHKSTDSEIADKLYGSTAKKKRKT